MKIKKKQFNNFMAVILLLLSVHFFGLYHRISAGLYDLIDLSYYIIAVIIFITSFVGTKSFNVHPRYWIFSRKIISIFIFLWISSVSCFYYHGQFPLLTLLASRFFLYLLLYFLLLALNLEKEFLIKLVYVFALIYMFVFTLQLILFPFELVPLGRTTEFERGLLRLRLEGVGFVTLGGLIALNNYVDSKKLKYAFFYSLCFFFIFLLGFRTLLAAYLITSFALMMGYERKITSRVFKILLFGFVLVLISQLPIISEFIEEITIKTSQDLSRSDSYIRIQTFNFLFSQVNPNIISLIFGNGMAFGGTSYGNLILIYGVEINGYIAADIGFLGFAFNYGTLTLLAFLSLFWTAFFAKLPSKYLYLRYFPFYLFISSFTTVEAYRPGMYGVICLSLVLLSIIASESNPSRLKLRKSKIE